MKKNKTTFELQEILNDNGFPHVVVIDEENVLVTVDDEPEIFNINDRVSGIPMSGLRYYGDIFGDHRMIDAIAEDIESVFELLNK